MFSTPINVLFYLLHPLLSKQDRPLMLLVPGREVIDLLMFSSKTCLVFTLFEHVASAYFNDVRIRAAEEDTGLFLMVFKVTHTHPAEFVLAVVASHVHAPFLLFDWCLTFGTGSTVDFKPISSVILTHTNALLPLFQ
jgi:hypothetical protein